MGTDGHERGFRQGLSSDRARPDGADGDWVHIPGQMATVTEDTTVSSLKDDVATGDKGDTRSGQAYIESVYGISYSDVVHRIRSISPFGRSLSWKTAMQSC